MRAHHEVFVPNNTYYNRDSVWVAATTEAIPEVRK